MPLLATDKQLAQQQLTTTGATKIYTCPDQRTVTYVKYFAIANTSAAAVTVSVWINQNGTSTGDQFALFKSMSVSANVTNQYIYTNAPLVLFGANASIMAQASSASTITLHLHGTEVVET